MKPAIAFYSLYGKNRNHDHYLYGHIDPLFNDTKFCGNPWFKAMTEQQQTNAAAVAFPSPPPFYQHFTAENLDRIAALRAAQQAGSHSPDSGAHDTRNVVSKPILRLLDLPPELRCLQPPEPPADGIYRSFGDVFNVSFFQHGLYSTLINKF